MQSFRWSFLTLHCIWSAGRGFAGQNWSYTSCSEGSKGPDHWADLAPEWAVCRDGRNQSPIDIHKYELSEDMELRMLPLTYDNRPQYNSATIANDGRTIKVIRGGGSLFIEGVNYSLSCIDFHSPSEHAINGVQYPLEMQVRHESPEGAFAIIVALFEEGEAQNPVLQQVTSKLGSLKKGETLSGVPVNIYSKPTDTHHYYQYQGSLTTPPCSEGVIWTIVSTIYKVSPDQLKLFKAALEGLENNREVQPMNERQVYVSAF